LPLESFQGPGEAWDRAKPPGRGQEAIPRRYRYPMRRLGRRLLNLKRMGADNIENWPDPKRNQLTNCDHMGYVGNYMRTLISPGGCRHH